MIIAIAALAVYMICVCIEHPGVFFVLLVLFFLSRR